MSIKPIDMQVLIPKTPEIHKSKQLEINSEKSSAHLISQKNIEEQYKTLKQVNKSDKLYKPRISKDDKKNSKEQHENEKRKKREDDKENKKDLTGATVHSRIDIKI